MTSKVQQQKDDQGYTKETGCCKNCNKFTSEKVLTGQIWNGKPIYKEKNKRCLIGGFAVQSSAYCDFFKRKD